MESANFHYEDTLGVKSALASVPIEFLLDLLHKVQDQTTCYICHELMFVPCCTSCGHTACYNCLYEWLKNQPQRKTCPTCRAHLKTPPYVTFTVKNTLEAMMAAVVDADASRERRLEAQKREALKLYKEHMKKYKSAFPKLFAQRAPVVDVEDEVMRCPQCNWELEHGVCANCGERVEVSDQESATDTEFSDDHFGENNYENDGFVVSDGYVSHDEEAPLPEDMEEYTMDWSDSSVGEGRRELYRMADSEARSVAGNQIYEEEISDDDDIAMESSRPRRRQMVVIDDDDEDFNNNAGRTEDTPLWPAPRYRMASSSSDENPLWPIDARRVEGAHEDSDDTCYSDFQGFADATINREDRPTSTRRTRHIVEDLDSE
ncbi:hypothetical protein TRVA0_017S01464 [Trichomonascus vanleenenianus]|uniref:uncharacterized protein n=1 Tax=Trichomonascus vanleenenianus TaxID=2268995 RepID=UPI003ECB03C2